MAKKKVCFIGNTRATCDFVSQEMLMFLGSCIEVKTWCLQESAVPSEYADCDIFIAANYTALSVVQSYIPENKPKLIAARTINIKNLDKLIKLDPGSKALVIGSTEETATMFISILQSLGFRCLKLIPYYPGCPSPPGDINLAITTGLANLVPREIGSIIDLGGKGMDLSTYAELLNHLGSPITVLNDISHKYIEAILKMTIRSERMASNNAELKRDMEVVLDTVHEAILAVNRDNIITLINPAAERLLDIRDAVGKNIIDVLPQLDFSGCFNSGESIINEIVSTEETNYIITANPNTDERGIVIGVVATIRQVSEVQELENKVRRALKFKGNIAKKSFKDVVGQSDELMKMVGLAKKFARTELTVLLQGESGTGKELIAQAIHNHSTRNTGPFVALNFAALPENLVESELFGYEDGAFTGAKKGGKAGLFEEAHKGTIFLDEIGDAPLEVQKKLLRVLEEREVRRVGGNTTTPVNVRVIAATNQDLESLVDQGKFRKDLYYRLCTVPIIIPALRKRVEDIETLIYYFVKKHQNRSFTLSGDLQEFLISYNWPGNIRELENVVGFLCTTADSHLPAEVTDLPEYLFKKAVPKSMGQPPDIMKPVFYEEGNKYELLMNEFANEGALEPIIIILQEMYQSSALNKSLGRNTLLKRLQSHDLITADHEVRRWLKILNSMGFIDAGITRQGSRLTQKGEDFMHYMQNIRRPC